MNQPRAITVWSRVPSRFSRGESGERTRALHQPESVDARVLLREGELLGQRPDAVGPDGRGQCEGREDADGATRGIHEPRSGVAGYAGARGVDLEAPPGVGALDREAGLGRDRV